METFQTFLVIFFALSIILLIIGGGIDSDDLTGFGIFLLIATLFLGTIGFWTQSSDKYETSYPKEIIFAKPGDTLIIQKISGDSIYLGTKPKQLSKKEKLITIQKQIDSLSVELNNIK